MGRFCGGVNIVLNGVLRGYNIDYGLIHEKTDSVIILSKLGFCVLFCRYIYKKQF